MNTDIRLQQRFENYKKAFNQFQSGVLKYQQSSLNELEKQGLIQAFEYTFELAWNLLRDYFVYQGITEIRGSRDAIKLGFKYGLIENGESWMKMISARNLTSHTYNERVVEELLKEIIDIYYGEFKKLLDNFINMRGN